MSEYSSELGPIPGTFLWRVTATGTEHRVLPDAVMDIIVAHLSALPMVRQAYWSASTTE